MVWNVGGRKFISCMCSGSKLWESMRVLFLYVKVWFRLGILGSIRIGIKSAREIYLLIASTSHLEVSCLSPSCSVCHFPGFSLAFMTCNGLSVGTPSRKHALAKITRLSSPPNVACTHHRPPHTDWSSRAGKPKDVRQIPIDLARLCLCRLSALCTAFQLSPHHNWLIPKSIHAFRLVEYGAPKMMSG